VPSFKIKSKLDQAGDTKNNFQFETSRDPLYAEYVQRPKKKAFVAILTSGLILALLLSGGGYWYYNNYLKKNALGVVLSSVDVPIPPAQDSSKKRPTVDIAGNQITNQLLSHGYNLGFIFSEPLLDLGMNLPVKTGSKDINTDIKQPKSLDDVISRPADPKKVEKRNLLEYPKYNITAPIQYANFEDLFDKNPDGTIKFESDPGSKNDPLDSPVQQKLVKGIVHTAFSVMPGEVGNSYIVGHTSNFNTVNSEYNTIFKPLESTSQSGEEFFIWDNYGRKLKFVVFEAIAIKEADVATAYKNFGDKRVVTLQGSILETVNGFLQPTKRWLTRGELVVETLQK
jgi:hypothetical protein